MRAVSFLIAIGSAPLLVAQSREWPAAQMYEARATSIIGQVTRLRDGQPWALSTGDRIPMGQVITTGSDGYAHFEVAGGSSFDLFSNSRILFRQNASNSGDLLDVVSGRVRIHLQPTAGQLQQRIVCPIATFTAHELATVALAVDEDDTVRIDVIEGAIRVQHTLLPRSEPVLVTAVDAILVQRDQQISRRLDRGSLYRYTVKPFKDVLSAITLGHSGHGGQDSTGTSKFLAQASPMNVVQSCGR